MTSRERVITAMRRKIPDRVPFGMDFTPGAYETFKKNSGATDAGEYFGFDSKYVGFWNVKGPDYSRYYKDMDFPKGTYFEPHGVAHVPGSIAHFTHIVSPLRNAVKIEELIEYPFPDFTLPEYAAEIKKKTEYCHSKNLAVEAAMGCTLFEWAWQIRGMEEFLTDLCTRTEWAEVLIDKWLDVRLYMVKIFCEAGVDILFTGDDVSMQTGMMFSPEIWRKVFKPRMARIIGEARRYKKDILVKYHSDGNPEKIIPDLIEVGVDILNPIQPECMDPAKIKKMYGDKLAFYGTIGTQSTFPFGTPEEMKRVVKERIDHSVK